jgi:hypothetical protein
MNSVIMNKSDKNENIDSDIEKLIVKNITLTFKDIAGM